MLTVLAVISQPAVVTSNRYFSTPLSSSNDFPPAVLAGGTMTTLKGDDIDYSKEPLNKAGLMASVNVDHKALLQKLPSWDHDKH